MEPDGFITITPSQNSGLALRQFFYFKDMRTWRKTSYGVEILYKDRSGHIVIPWSSIDILKVTNNSQKYVDYITKNEGSNA